MIRRLLVGLIGILILVSCAVHRDGFIASDRKKNIKLTSISGQLKIGYETDSAIIYIGQLDAVLQTEKLLSSKKLNPRFDNRLIVDLNKNLDALRKIRTDTLFQHWQNQKDSVDIKSYEFAGFIDQSILRDLILKGKTEVWNKTTKRFEKMIIYHFIKDKLGGESCTYSFQNGTEFHRQQIALGE